MNDDFKEELKDCYAEIEQNRIDLNEYRLDVERLRALLKEVDDWVRDLEPFADAGHEPVTVFKKVRAALAQEKHDD
jgi:hypothetical protein